MLQPVLDKNRSSQGKQAVTEALFEAINNANITKVAEFLNAYPRLNEDKDQMGRTPIQALTEAPVWVWQENDRPRQEIYHLLVQSGADPTVVSAIVSGDVDGIRGFLDRDAPFIHMPLETHGGKHLPLSLAAIFNRPAVMEQLIMAGADVHADYEAALIEAAWSNSVKAAEMLFQHGAQINPSSRESHPLHHACYDISPKTAIFLLNNNADPNALGRIGRVEGSPLMMALKTYNRWDGEWKHQIIEGLIEAGANYRDDAMMAIHRGRVDLLQQQLDANPELVHQRFEMPNDNTYCPLNGGTLLHLVAEYNEYPNALVNAKQLLARGADINARTKKSVDGTDGHTPIFHLLRIWIQTSEKLLNFLIEQGADLTVKGTFMVNGEQLELTPLGFELRRQPNPPYSGGPSQRVIEMLRANGAAE